MLATLEDLDPISGGLSEDEVDDVIAIVEEFTAAPDVAAEFEAPDGLEDVQDAFEALADGYAEVATTFTDWLDTDAGSDEEADAEDAYNEALDAVIDLQDDFDAAVEDAGGSSDGSDGRDDEEDATDDSADDSTGDAADDGSTDDEDATDDDGGSGGDADAYLEDVRTHADELVAGADRLIEILSSDEVTDADREDLAAILELWADAPDVAADMDVPDGMEEVQEAYEETADAYATVVDNFDAWLATDAETTESEEAFQEFIDSLTEAMELSDTLDGLLADEGA
jgi:hypothetical protein